MKPIDPLKFDSLSDLIRVVTSSGRKKAKSAQGGLRSLGSRTSYVKEPKDRSRRVVIKTRVVKNNGSRWQSRRADHAAYLQRDGTSIDGKKTELYYKYGMPVDVDKFLKRSEFDPHEFRFIISPEDANQIDLTTFTLKFMDRMENELGTKLDWMAANHYNTDKPHTHLVLRGVNELGETLLLDKDFISHGMRNIAREIVTNELGERTDLEIQNEVFLSLHNRRVTQLDQRFEWMASQEFSRIIHISKDMHILDVPFDEKVQLDRLRFLVSIGLAKEITGNNFLIVPELISKLREMGIQGDIIKMMHRESRSIGNKECLIYDAAVHGQIRGTVSARDIANELTDQEYIIVETADEKAYFVRLNITSENQKCLVGDEVTIDAQKPRSIFGKRVELILELAAANDGFYDPAKLVEWAQENMLFSEAKFKDGPKEYAANFDRQLDKLVNLGLLIERGDGTYLVVEDVREKMKLFDEEHINKHRPSVEVNRVDLELSPDGTKRTINGVEYVVYNAEEHGKADLIGTVMFRGVNLKGNDFITLATLKENRFYVELPKLSEWDKSAAGDTVRILQEKQSVFKKADHDIFQCAKENGLVYDAELHFKWSRKIGKSTLSVNASEQERKEFVERHIKRMVFLEHFGLAQAIGENRWQIDSDFNAKIEALKTKQEAQFRPRLRVQLEKDTQKTHLELSLEMKGFASQRSVNGREVVLFKKEDLSAGPLKGRVLGKGILENNPQKPFLLLETQNQTRFLVPVEVNDNNSVRLGDNIKISFAEARPSQPLRIEVLSRPKCERTPQKELRVEDPANMLSKGPKR